MKTFASEFTDELAAETAAMALLVDFEFDTPVYYNWPLDIPVVTGGKRYLPKDMDIRAIPSAGGLAASRVEIDMASVDQTVASLLLSEDAAGTGVLISMAAIGSDYRVVKEGAGDAALFGSEAITFGAEPLSFGSGDDVVYPLFRGMISTYRLDELNATISCVNELILWSKKTLRKCHDSCPWPFKGTECGYSGAATWCDQSYARCTALGNQNNFGGFRFIKATQEKEIRWGRV